VKTDGLLLIGPTGSGKTPLGLYLEKNGLWGRRCAHFDFGGILRSLDRDPHAFPELKEDAVQVVRESLRTGALLENETFYIAEHLLSVFFRTRSWTERSLLVLNGLPRHIGQAGDLARTVQVRAVVSLLCPAKTVLVRIRENTGGDRTGRMDDSLSAVQKKWKIYEQRARPLLDYFRKNNIPVIEIEVTPDTNPGRIVFFLESQKPMGM
jgi:adenylate kinase